MMSVTQPSNLPIVDRTELRARFARLLAVIYGKEVPAYTTLVDVSREVNLDVVSRHRRAAQRLGSIDRVTAERHGAIRVGSPNELAAMARLFAAFDMHPVGFYDLRDRKPTGVPVVSTAFRPIDIGELAKNPFRVFTSMLVIDDPRFFDSETQTRLGGFIRNRRVLSDEVLELADRAAAEGWLSAHDADRFLQLATSHFQLSREPLNRSWYEHLAKISSVAADIGGTDSTHINHLTPRVLDIDALYERMGARGIEMIDAIQGPPKWDGPDVLLRQTSFRALAERRRFQEDDGSVSHGDLRVRFGEVEQRGIALTPLGVALYEETIGSGVDGADAGQPGDDQASLRATWEARFPRSEADLESSGTGWFTYKSTGLHTDSPQSSLSGLIRDGALSVEPIVYEDFLPRSAAGIFRSNLTSAGTMDDLLAGPEYDIDRIAGIIDRPVHDPQELYRAQRERSLDVVRTALGRDVIDDVPTTSA